MLLVPCDGPHKLRSLATSACANIVQLPEKHPQLYAEFLKGNFVVQRSPHKFSLIGKDQSHEQSNKNLQAHGPDCSRCIEEFESVLETASSCTAHHEEASALQTRYKEGVLSFVEIVEQLGNPFGNGHELVALHTQEVMKDEVVASLAQLHNLGKELHAKFVAHSRAGHFANNNHYQTTKCSYICQSPCYHKKRRHIKEC